MSLEKWSETDLKGLEAFYTEGHLWKWDDIRQGRGKSEIHVLAFLNDLPLPRKSPIFLPNRRVDKSLFWYAIAFSDRQVEELRDMLNAFVGRAGCKFSGQRHDLDVTYAPEAALLGWLGKSLVYKIQPLEKKYGRLLFDEFKRMSLVLNIRPTSRSAVYQSIPYQIRSFQSALLTKNKQDAEFALQNLEDSGNLSSENQRFLQIDMFGEFGESRKLCREASKDHYQSARCPRHILATLIEAIWQQHLSAFLAAKDADGALKCYKEDVQREYAHILQSRKGVERPLVILTFLLAAAAEPERRGDQIKTLLTLLPEGNLADFGQAIATLVELPIAESEEGESEPVLKVPETEKDNLESPINRAQVYYHNGDFDSAWIELKGADLRVESVELLLLCAEKIQTTEVVEFAINRFNELKKDEQDTITNKHLFSSLLERLWELATAVDKDPIESWGQWLEQLEDENRYEELECIAEDSRTMWEIDYYLRNPSILNDFSDRIFSERSGDANRFLHRMLPQVVRYFVPDGAGMREFIGVYRGVIDFLEYQEGMGRDDWGILQVIMVAVMDAGPDSDTYKVVLNALSSIWSNSGDFVRLEWALDMLDLIATHSVRDELARDRLFSTIFKTLNDVVGRIDRTQLNLFKIVAIDFKQEATYEALVGQIPEEEDSAEDALPKVPQNTQVGIYSLNERGARGACEYLETTFPGLKTRFSKEHVGSNNLRSMSEEVDYFIVTTGAAKHAATEYIKNKRPNNKSELIYPEGVGRTSIIRAFLRAIAN